MVSLTEDRLQQLLENATADKDLREYHLTTAISSKFAYEILNHRPSERFKQPDLPKYDATKRDPNGHMHDFEKQLILFDDVALQCKLFHAILIDEATWWFD